MIGIAVDADGNHISMSSNGIHITEAKHTGHKISWTNEAKAKVDVISNPESEADV